MTEKQKKLVTGKEDKESPCFTLATMMKKYLMPLKGLSWHCQTQ